MNENRFGIVVIHRWQLIDLLSALDGNTLIKASGVPPFSKLVAMHDDPFSDSILLRFNGPNFPNVRPGMEAQRYSVQFEIEQCDNFAAILAHERNLKEACQHIGTPTIICDCGEQTLYRPDDKYCAYCAKLLPDRKPFVRADEPFVRVPVIRPTQ